MPGDIVALVAALAALATGGAALWQQQRGTKTDTTSAAAKLTAAASGLVHDLHDEIERLRTAVSDLQHLVSALESEIVTLGGDPQRIRLEVSALRRRTDRIEGNPI